MNAPAKFRIELKGDGRILNASGNPIDGNEKENLVRMANCHDDLLEALIRVADWMAASGQVPNDAYSWGVRAAIKKATKGES